MRLIWRAVVTIGLAAGLTIAYAGHTGHAALGEQAIGGDPQGALEDYSARQGALEDYSARQGGLA
jgi:hypothetical protein